jgi:hypothetical protein
MELVKICIQVVGALTLVVAISGGTLWLLWLGLKAEEVGK